MEELPKDIKIDNISIYISAADDSSLSFNDGKLLITEEYINWHNINLGKNIIIPYSNVSSFGKNKLALCLFLCSANDDIEE